MSYSNAAPLIFLALLERMYKLVAFKCVRPTSLVMNANVISQFFFLAFGIADFLIFVSKKTGVYGTFPSGVLNV